MANSNSKTNVIPIGTMHSLKSIIVASNIAKYVIPIQSKTLKTGTNINQKETLPER